MREASWKQEFGLSSRIFTLVAAPKFFETECFFVRRLNCALRPAKGFGGSRRPDIRHRDGRHAVVLIEGILTLTPQVKEC